MQTIATFSYCDGVKFFKNLSVSGTITATSFVGNGANLTNAAGWAKSGSDIVYSGNVGIGTTDVSGAKLTIGGNLDSRGADFCLGKNDGRSQGSSTSNRALVHGGWINKDELIINYNGDFEGGTYVFGPKFVVNGNVGIGTSNPTSALTVNGKILAEEFEIVTDVPASDYVFESNYKLRPLHEVEAFVAKNKHLPEVPSAKEFKENGYKVGQMDDLLLRKVEELTLYTIELNKQVEALKAELAKVKGGE